MQGACERFGSVSDNEVRQFHTEWRPRLNGPGRFYDLAGFVSNISQDQSDMWTGNSFKAARGGMPIFESMVARGFGALDAGLVYLFGPLGVWFEVS